jgi:hypothetical protein
LQTFKQKLFSPVSIFLSSFLVFLHGGNYAQHEIFPGLCLEGIPDLRKKGKGKERAMGGC